MSRWTEQFKNHGFRDSWQELLIKRNTLAVVDPTIETHVTEMARLKKVISYLDELVSAVDPELVPLNIWNQFHEQAQACIGQINSFEQNKDIGHIQNANGNLDNLLSYIRPYMVSGKGAAQAAGRAFIAYAESVSENIKKLSDLTSETVRNTKNNEEVTQRLLKAAEDAKAKIDAIERRLFEGTDEEDSLQEQLDTLHEEAQEWHEAIGQFHKRLTSGTETESAIILQIEEAKRKIFSNRDDIIEGRKAVDEQFKNLGTFYQQIFGQTDEEGKTSGGLKNELEIRSAELSEFKEIQQKAYKTSLEEIESLLPGATSAGLASAYHELKTSFDKPIHNASNLFYAALAGLLTTAFLMITHKIGFLYIEFVEFTPEELPVLLTSLAYKLPFLLPLLWLAIFATKRRSEASRLQQEYAHKEAIAKSYQSFKQQIEALNKEDDILMVQLLEKAIFAIAFNASVTLDGKHGDKMPILETLDKLAEKIDLTELIKGRQ